MKRSPGLVALALFTTLTAAAATSMAQDDDGLDDLPGTDDGDGDSSGDGDGSGEDGGAKASASLNGMDGSMSSSLKAKRWRNGTRLTLPKNTIQIQAFLEINLSKDAVFKPVAVQPDIWYGVNDELTVGLVHSPRALGGFLVGGFPGGGLCLGSTSVDDPVTETPACKSTYSTVGVLGRYHLLDAPVIVAADGGLIVNDFDPFALSLKLGATAEYPISNKIVALFGLNVSIGLAGRDDGNKEFLNLPVAVMYKALAKLDVGVQTGFRTPFSEAGDNFSVPLALGARYIINEKITLDGSFSLPLLITGVPDASGVAARVITLGGSYIL